MQIPHFPVISLSSIFSLSFSPSLFIPATQATLRACLVPHRCQTGRGTAKGGFNGRPQFIKILAPLHALKTRYIIYENENTVYSFPFVLEPRKNWGKKTFTIFSPIKELNT